MKRMTMKYAALAAVAVLLGATAWTLNEMRGGSSPLMPEAAAQQDKMNLRLFISGPASSRLPAPENDFVRQTIERKFNVSLSITFMEPGNEYETKIASLLAANDPPDMWLELSPDGGAQHTLDNVLADMTYYVTPKTMPNYFRYWMNETELREYLIHNKFARAPIPYDKQSHRSYYIRKDWLDKLGLSFPETYDDYYNVLKAFTHKDPDGNGKADTFGFSTSGNGTSISLEWPEYVKNGLLFPTYFDGEKLVDMQMDAKIGQTVTDILKVMDDGIVDPDWFLNKDRQHIDKAVQGKIGVVLGNTADFAFDANPDSIQSRTKAIDSSADWEPFNPFGNKPLRAESAPEIPFVYSNNAAGLQPEKLKRITQILDWLAGDEGFLLTHYGVENADYTRQGNTITLIPDKIKTDIVDQGDFLKIWDFFTPETPNALGFTVIDPRRTARDESIADFIERIPVHDGLGTTLTPPLGISVEAMRARQNELQVKMMFSDKSADRWPEYRLDIMEHYDGELIFREYEDKIRQAHNLLRSEE